ncbi:hypothetical protein JXB12_11360 [candidate division KSB1 bacterium]|nr:hypothetical protein [candidate division KSB1 bacterium]
MKKYWIVPLFFVLALSLATNVYVIDFVKDTFTSDRSGDDFFARLSMKYYGTADYSTELAIVNQAINYDKGVPDETALIVPTERALIELYNCYDMVKGREIAQRVIQESRNARPASEHRSAFLGGNMFSPILGLVLASALALGFFIGKKSNHDLRHITDTPYYTEYTLANQSGS